MSEKIKLPKGWEMKKLGEVCKFVGGGTPSKQVDSYWNGDIPWASIKDMKGTHLHKTSDFITDEGVKNSSTNIANPNELILATRINPGRVILTKIRTAINQDLKVVRPLLEIDTSFLYYSFQNLERDILKVSSGTTVLGIGLNLLNEIKFFYPPLSEQTAIVSKIEELLSDLENGKQQLLTAQAQLKVYRQSLLKWAFEGKLTNKKVKEGELPKGWKLVTVTDIVENNKHSLKAGPFGSSLKKEFYVSKGYKIYGQEQVIIDNPFFGNYYVNEEKYDELKSCRVKPFDILISLVGTVGKVLILPENCELGVINPRLIKISINKDIYFNMFAKIGC